jgi:hypothetical protein
MAALVASTAGAQGLSPTMSDATIVSRGAIRFRGEMQWTRIDGIFGPGGSPLHAVGAPLSGELTAATFPMLVGGQAAARVLANDPGLILNAGRLTTSADSRIATVPISLEYGLTSRIAIGLTVPIVQTRTVVTTQLNGRADSVANVGTNPARFHQSTAAYAQNAAVFNAMDAALTQLELRRAQCAASPSLSGCPEFNARSAEASELAAAAFGFTSAIGFLYGVSNAVPGAPLVPVAGSPAQAAIDARLAELRAAFTSFGYNAGAGSLAAAQAQAANAQLQRLVSDPAFGIGLDSIGTTEQTAIGDVEVGASTLLFNTFGRASGLRLRGVAAGVLRLGTGHTPRPSRPFDIGTGDGQTDVEARAALDAQTGRLLTTLAATYTLQLGSVPTVRLRTTPGTFFDLDLPVAGSVKLGNMMSARLNPRYMITPALTAGAVGIVSHRGADEVAIDEAALSGLTAAPSRFAGSGSFTVVSGGVTLAYSNVASVLGTGGRDFPAEIVFTHLQTLSASDQGAEHRRRDSIELRLYFRTRR